MLVTTRSATNTEFADTFMPELPDIEAYLHALRGRVVGETLRGLVVRSPFLVRTVEPRPSEAVGRRVEDVARIGKRIVFAFSDELHFVIHLMIAGRFRLRKPGTLPPKKRGLAAFHFDAFTLLLTEEGSKKRASLHVVQGKEALAQHDPGGMEIMNASPGVFAVQLRESNRTLKRTLTDPRIFSGIGNAYSDEILHRARLSPFRRTGQLSDDEVLILFNAIRGTMKEWTDRLIAEVGGGFPEKVTAFRPEMAVHGRYGEPCPECAAPIQRVVYAEREMNYCPGCQTEGRILADRSLSRLLKDDWPKTIEELESQR